MNTKIILFNKDEPETTLMEIPVNPNPEQRKVQTDVLVKDLIPGDFFLDSKGDLCLMVDTKKGENLALSPNDKVTKISSWAKSEEK